MTPTLPCQLANVCDNTLMGKPKVAHREAMSVSVVLDVPQI